MEKMEPESSDMALYIEATERKRGWRPILAVRFITATRYGIVVKRRRKLCEADCPTFKVDCWMFRSTDGLNVRHPSRRDD